MYKYHGNTQEENEVAQSCQTLCDPVDCSLPCSSVYGIFRAQVLEWVAISFSGGSFRPRDGNQVSRVVGRHFTILATREVHTQEGNTGKYNNVGRGRVVLFVTLGKLSQTVMDPDYQILRQKICKWSW